MQPSFRLKNVLTGETYSLSQPSSVIGRNHHCEIRIDSVALSRNHASLHLTELGVVLEDLNSTNGTYVNNYRIESPTLLSDGDVITIGNHRLVLVEPTQNPGSPFGQQKSTPTPGHLAEDLAYFEMEDRTSNKTMLHSAFARSMGVLPEVNTSNKDESNDELIARALKSKPFDRTRVPAILVVKNSRKRGMLIQLKLPVGGAREWAIGRSKLADVVLDDPTVSNVHAIMTSTREGWHIADNDSTNGIKINQSSVAEGACQHGDTLTIGSIDLIFYLLNT